MKYIPLLTKIRNMAILATKQCYMIWYLATTTNSGLNLLTLLNLILLQTYTSSLHHETKPTYKQTVIESKVSQLAHKLVAKVLVLGTQVTYCMLQWKYEQNLQNQWHIIPLLPAFLAWPDFNVIKIRLFDYLLCDLVMQLVPGNYFPPRSCNCCLWVQGTWLRQLASRSVIAIAT